MCMCERLFESRDSVSLLKKGEFAQHQHVVYIATTLSKVVHCRGVRKRFIFMWERVDKTVNFTGLSTRISYFVANRLCVAVVNCPPRVREVVGSISCRFIPKPLKMVVMAVSFELRVAGLAVRLTIWCHDKRTSSTGN